MSHISKFTRAWKNETKKTEKWNEEIEKRWHSSPAYSLEPADQNRQCEEEVPDAESSRNESAVSIISESHGSQTSLEDEEKQSDDTFASLENDDSSESSGISDVASRTEQVAAAEDHVVEKQSVSNSSAENSEVPPDFTVKNDGEPLVLKIMDFDKNYEIAHTIRTHNWVPAWGPQSYSA